MDLDAHPVRTMQHALFPIDGAFEFGLFIFDLMKVRIKGWAAGNRYEYGILAQAVKNAGDGNYLEIGSAWGGSAIVAATTKREYNLTGRVVCVDPLDGMDTVLNIPHSARALKDNLERFDLGNDVELIQDYFENVLVMDKFNCVLIDGDHRSVAVHRDLDTCKKMASGYILFHDYDCAHTGVMHAAGFSELKTVCLFGSMMVQHV